MTNDKPEQSERERLIKELESKFYEPYKRGVLDTLTIGGAADFILADRKRIVKPLVSLQKEYADSTFNVPHSLKAVTSALKLAGYKI